VVECDLAKVEVAGSNPVSRSRQSKDEGGRMRDESELLSPPFFGFILPPSSFILPGRRRSQVVRQRSAKPLFIGSIPIAASKA
jgi:hypothetical protein